MFRETYPQIASETRRVQARIRDDEDTAAVALEYARHEAVLVATLDATSRVPSAYADEEHRHAITQIERELDATRQLMHARLAAEGGGPLDAVMRRALSRNPAEG